MELLAELKPAFRCAQSRTADLGRVIGAEARKIRPVVRSRVFTVFLYFCIASTLIASTIAFTKIVQVNDKNGVRYAFTLRNDPKSILSQCGVKLRPEDNYDFSGFKKNYGQIKIYRAFDVSVTADNRTKTIQIARGTVQDALKKADVSMGSDDLISKPLNESVRQGMNVRVQRVTYQTEVQDQPISCKINDQTTTLLEKGTAQVLDPGKNGVFTTTTKLRYVDGRVADRTVQKQEMTKQPVDGKRLVGTAIKTPVSRIEPEGFLLSNRGEPQRYSKVYEGLATAYCAKNGAGTASGMKAAVGRVAVDPSIIPYGTRLYIVSADGSFVYGYAVAADTGGFVFDKKVLVDLYFNSEGECDHFGVQKIKMYVLQ